jgi:hypothetical protein
VAGNELASMESCQEVVIRVPIEHQGQANNWLHHFRSAGSVAAKMVVAVKVRFLKGLNNFQTV